MDNLEPLSKLDPGDVPAGFTMADPNNSGGSGGGGANANSSAATSDNAQNAQKQAVLDQALTIEARARLRRIQLVKPAKAAAVESIICNMALSGKLPGAITEDKLIELLEQRHANSSAAVASTLNTTGSAATTGTTAAQRSTTSATTATAAAGSISIQRKKYAMDSDDDDNDDDLL